MAYSHTLLGKTGFGTEFTRFVIKLLFCFVLILLAWFICFEVTFGILVGLLILGGVVSKIFCKKNNWLTRIVNKCERSYEEGFPGKEALVSLLGFIAVFVVIWIAKSFVEFPLFWALVVGLLSVSVNTGFAALVLSKLKHQFVIYGTTMEFLILSTILGTLVFVLIGFPVVFALFLAIIPNLFMILPWLNHNLVTFLVSVLAYIVLWI